ncbi:hypothetical protein F5144DRAFT_650891, partial [Chaetomium tenue]
GCIRHFAGLDTQEARSGVVCYFVGAGLTFIGMAASACITDAATTERCWRYCPFKPTMVDKDASSSTGLGNYRPAAVVWLQRHCSVEGQSLLPYAIWKPSQAGEDDMAVYVSLRNENPTKHWWMRMVMAMALLFTVPGAILQPFGTWTLRWKAGVAQVVAMAVMTIVRAISRGYLAQIPANYEVTDTQELASLVISIRLFDKGFLEAGNRLAAYFILGLEHGQP